MARPGDRRPLVADHAIAVLASGGARALSHQAVDRAAGLPSGSSSYYFRTRRELVVAAVERIRERSRSAFAGAAPPEPLTSDAAAGFIAVQLLRLIDDRRDDALAVFALLPEVEHDPGLREGLAGCLFSLELAEGLMRALGRDEAIALDLVDLLTGLLFGLLFGRRRSLDPRGESVRGALRRFLAS